MGKRIEGEIRKTLDRVWTEWPWEKALPREQLDDHMAAELNKLFERELPNQEGETKQLMIFSSDPKYVNAMERFELKVKEAWQKGFVIATDSLQILATEKGVIVAAIMECEEPT